MHEVVRTINQSNLPGTSQSMYPANLITFLINFPIRREIDFFSIFMKFAMMPKCSRLRHLWVKAHIPRAVTPLPADPACSITYLFTRFGYLSLLRKNTSSDSSCNFQINRKHNKYKQQTHYNNSDTCMTSSLIVIPMRVSPASASLRRSSAGNDVLLSSMSSRATKAQGGHGLEHDIIS